MVEPTETGKTERRQGTGLSIEEVQRRRPIIIVADDVDQPIVEQVLLAGQHSTLVLHWSAFKLPISPGNPEFTTGYIIALAKAIADGLFGWVKFHKVAVIVPKLSIAAQIRTYKRNIRVLFTYKCAEITPDDKARLTALEENDNILRDMRVMQELSIYLPQNKMYTAKPRERRQ